MQLEPRRTQALPVLDPLDLTPTSSLAPARLRGALLVSSLRWLTGDHGLPRIGAIYGALPAREKDLLATVRLDQWYPLQSWETFLHVADDMLGRGDLALCESLGRGAASRSLRGVVEKLTPVPMAASPYSFLARALRRWRTDTCSAGSWVMTCESTMGATARLHELAVGPAFGRFLAGWLAGHMLSEAGRCWMSQVIGPGEFMLCRLREV